MYICVFLLNLTTPGPVVHVVVEALDPAWLTAQIESWIHQFKNHAEHIGACPKLPEENREGTATWPFPLSLSF